MKSLRTPDERFADLDGYPFAPNYVDVPADPDGTEEGGAPQRSMKGRTSTFRLQAFEPAVASRTAVS
ncbi:MAG: hypothetical protein RL391_740 [Actinomycetota bacterium]|jgi:hypothetical protein